MNELHLFAGAGGGILGGQLLGHRCVCAVEWEPFAQAGLVARQNDGTFAPFPIWDDVQTFDGKPWRGLVDVVAGGFPCQDISVAGGGAGLDGQRSGMWHHMARIIGEVRPQYAFIENSPALVSRGLDRVLSDLAALGFDAVWTVLGASDLGAHHHRERMWILAHARCIRCQGGTVQHITQPECHPAPHAGHDGGAQPLAHTHGLRQLQPQGSEQDQRGRLGDCSADVAHAGGISREGQQPEFAHAQERAGPEQRPAGPCGYAFRRWPTEPRLGRVAHGVAHRPNRIKAIGNGQVPRVAAAAFHFLKTQLEQHGTR